MRKSIVILSVMALCASVFSGIVSAAPTRTEINVIMDGHRLPFPDARPFIDGNNRTLVPVRFVAENLGAKVAWHDDVDRVDISLDGKYISLTIGDKNALVNGEEVEFDTAAVVRENRTFVPLRFVSDALGEQVEWDGFSRYVYVGEKVFLTPEELGIEPVSVDEFKHMYPPRKDGRINYYLTDSFGDPVEQVYVIKGEHLPLNVGGRIIYDLWVESAGRIGGRYDIGAMPFYFISDDGFGPRPRNQIHSLTRKLEDNTSMAIYPVVGAGDKTFLKDPNFDKYNLQIPVYIGVRSSYKPKTMIMLENPF